MDPVGIAICRANGSQRLPSAATVSNTVLVVWDDSRLGSHVTFGARVSSLGVVLDPQGIALSASLAGQFNPKVTAGTTNYFVVWASNSASERAVNE